MPTRPPRFTAIPAIPQAGVPEPQFSVLTAMKDNLDLLIGAKIGANSDMARAITRSQIGVQPLGKPSFLQGTAQGTGYTISDVTVPSLDDHVKLIEDVQRLGRDVANIREVLNALITQLKGRS